MRFKRPIYRYLFFAAWFVVLGGITTLVIAANGKTSSRTCKEINIIINGDGDRIFVEKGDVLKNIQQTAGGALLNKKVDKINLGELERSLEKGAWVRDAELYFDTKNVLHVSVWERQPIARVFTTAGNSFYIDSAGFQLPLLETYSAKLPVVTGFTDLKKWSRRDSVILKGLKEVIAVVSNDVFWNAQVGQIDIAPDGKIELIPMIGSHIIKLGYAENVEQKLNNLLVFYKSVLPKAGLAKYSIVDVQFQGQVVAVKRGGTSSIDSIQLQKNIEELMKKKAAEQEPADIVQAVYDKAADPVVVKKDSVAKPITQKPKSATVVQASNPTPKKTTAQKPKPVKPTNQQVKKSEKKPKAVMPSKRAMAD